MEKRSYRFKKEFYTIDGERVGLLVISIGHGYDLQTFCCGNCGEIFVLDREYLFHRNVDLETVLVGKKCPTCDAVLLENWFEYPEFVFSGGKILQNPNEINRVHFDHTEIVDAYTIT